MIEHLASAIAADFAGERPLNIVGIRTRGETLAGASLPNCNRMG